MPTTRTRTRARRTRAPAPPAELIEDLAESWVTHLGAEHKAPATIKLYAGAVAQFTAWHRALTAPGLPVPPVTAACLDRDTAAAFLSDLLAGGSAPATARARYSALRQFAAWLATEHVTDDDVLLGMHPPKLDQRRVDALTDAELAAMIKACKVPAGADTWTTFTALRDEAVLRLLADTGLRAGELLALRTDDVDLHRRLATVIRAKGGKHRVAAFGPEAARAIDRYLRRARRGHKLARGPALWLGDGNRAWGYHAMSKALRRRAEAAGVTGFHAHRLRHTAASAALDAGLSEGTVMAQMGWSSRAMLDVYVEDTRQRRAAQEFAQYFNAKGR